MKAHRLPYVLTGRRLAIQGSDHRPWVVDRFFVQCRCGNVFLVYLPAHRVVCHHCNAHAEPIATRAAVVKALPLP